MLGSGGKEMHFFSPGFGFLGFSDKHDKKYKPQGTFKEVSHLQRLAVAIQFE